MRDGGAPYLKVATWNVHKCKGVSGFRPQAVSEAIVSLGADVVALQEVDRRFGPQRGRGLLHLETIRKGGMEAVTPDRPGGHGWHGNTLVLGRDVELLCIRALDLPAGEPRGAVSADVETSHGPIRFVAMHLGLLSRNRRRQVASVMKWLATMPEMPTVAMGDMNEWRAIGSLAGLIGPDGHTGRAGPSFPSGMPVAGLDRIIGIQGVEVRQRRVVEDGRVSTMSDHLPVVAYLGRAA